MKKFDGMGGGGGGTLTSTSIYTEVEVFGPSTTISSSIQYIFTVPKAATLVSVDSTVYTNAGDDVAFEIYKNGSSISYITIGDSSSGPSGAEKYNQTTLNTSVAAGDEITIDILSDGSNVYFGAAEGLVIGLQLNGDI